VTWPSSLLPACVTLSICFAQFPHDAWSAKGERPPRPRKTRSRLCVSTGASALGAIGAFQAALHQANFASECPTRALPEFHSVGVACENEKVAALNAQCSELLSLRCSLRCETDGCESRSVHDHLAAHEAARMSRTHWFVHAATQLTPDSTNVHQTNVRFRASRIPANLIPSPWFS
jgi:hypothetical protein